MVLFGATSGKTKITETNTGQGDASSLLVSYKNWQQDKIKNNSAKDLNLQLGWIKGVSTENSAALGAARVDLADGSVKLKIKDLDKGEWQLWLIENHDGPGTSTMPDAGDRMVSVGNFQSDGQLAEMVVQTDVSLLAGMKIDRAVISRAGKSPLESLILTGSPDLFERIEHNQININETSNKGLVAMLLTAFSPTVSADASSLDALVARGRDIFVKETFQGNGRTCATCHPQINNFTLDPKFIATLSSRDPLFVAEFNPALSHNFENPQMMRKFGLILENADGFEDLEHKFVLRGVPHTLGMRNTITAPDPFVASDFTVNFKNPNPTQRLGWSGDGAAGSGTLREFAIGAVVQHFPKTLQRAAGSDFRLPTDAELDAMEAFQLSLGRQEELNLSSLQVNEPLANSGKALFLDTGFFSEPGHKNCNACHFNAGANNGFGFNPGAPGFSPKLDGNPLGFNASQGTAVNLLPQVAANHLPPDGGFGKLLLPDGGYGNYADVPGLGSLPAEEFNSPSLIEAADTGPYFHNNMVATLEEAVAFYGTPAFQDISSIGGPVGPVPVSISSDPKNPEVQAIAAFLRTLNAVENIRSSISIANRAINATTESSRKDILALAIRDNADAILVLTSGAYASNASAQVKLALVKLASSAARLAIAYKAANNKTTFDATVKQALNEQRDARAALVNPTTLPSSFRN